MPNPVSVQPVSVLMILTVRYGKNGITNCVMNYVSRFDPARVRCDLVCPNEPGEQARAMIRQTGGEVFILGGRNRRPLRYWNKLSRIIRERGEEIVHAHGNSATLYLEMMAAKRGGAKHRLPHSHNTTCKMKTADRLLRGVFYRSYTHAVACSAAAGEWLYPGRPYDVLNNAIDADAFRFHAATRREMRERLGLQPEETVFLHVGAFNEQKNQAFLLEAFGRYLEREPNARLLLVGEGERRPSCGARAETLGIGKRVEFLGQRDDIPALLFASDAFVLPSLHEGLPLTLVEAQCAGLPCLASDRVTPESALTALVTFFPVERVEAFAEAMAGLARPERTVASEDAIRRVAEAGFDVSRNAGSLMKLYESLARA
ncbi:MAG: glycosyltransferase [Christensenella sp.]|nr:glycosyltransferase [Christensenella sp.]